MFSIVCCHIMRTENAWKKGKENEDWDWEWTLMIEFKLKITLYFVYGTTKKYRGKCEKQNFFCPFRHSLFSLWYWRVHIYETPRLVRCRTHIDIRHYRRRRVGIRVVSDVYVLEVHIYLSGNVNIHACMLSKRKTYMLP